MAVVNEALATSRKVTGSGTRALLGVGCRFGARLVVLMGLSRGNWSVY